MGPIKHLSQQSERFGRRARHQLRRASMMVLTLVTAFAGVLIGATVASAHANAVSGSVACVTSPTSANLVVTWTISNDYNLSETATATSVTDGLGTLSPTSVYINASPTTSNESTGTMIQTLAQNATGSVTLNVSGTWSDNYQGSASGTVTLPGGCVFTPQVTTAPASGAVNLGASNTDTITVTGLTATPTGTADFYVCGPTTSAVACTTAGTLFGFGIALTGSGNTATATSPSYAPSATGTYCFLGIYSGDANYAGGGDSSTTRECFSDGKATPSFTTTPSVTSIVLGGSASDKAVVTGFGEGAPAPSGAVTFFSCKETTPGTPCVAGTEVAVVTTPVVTGGDVSTYSLAANAFTPSTAGSYCFNASYAGDANYGPLAAESNPAAECFSVTPATPSATTVPGNASVVLGSSNTDVLTVTGANNLTPTGTATFYLCGPTTSAAACTTAGTKLNSTGIALSGSGNTATATSPSTIPAATGTYCFLGVYSGDANYAGAQDSSTTRECFTVIAKTVPANLTVVKVDTTPGNGAAIAPGGMITYNLNLQNTGAVATGTATVSDAIPPGSTYVANSAVCSSSFPGSCSASFSSTGGSGNGVVSYTVNLNAVSSATVAFDVTVNAGTPNGTVIPNAASYTNLNNTCANAASCTTNVVANVTEGTAPAAAVAAAPKKKHHATVAPAAAPTAVAAATTVHTGEPFAGTGPLAAAIAAAGALMLGLGELLRRRRKA